MVLAITLEEAKDMILHSIRASLGGLVSIPSDTPVRFIHTYADGSGEADVEDVAPIDRIEIGINDLHG